MPAEIQPTQNMTRQAIFDLIGHDLSGIEFLELYAGSGAVGLEALSRGADKVTFVEKSPKCIDTIEENLAILGLNNEGGLDDSVEIINADAMMAVKMFARQKRQFDVIFLDPPYGVGLVKKTLKTLMAYDILRHNCFVIVQYGNKDTLPDLDEGRVSVVKHRKYGKSFLTVLEKIAS